MLILRIKQAECALADGRLDEACEIAQAEDVRRHRHGQRLISRLRRAFVQRGRQNLEADRLQPALADCNKAERLAGSQSDVAQLREAVCKAIAEQQHRHAQEAHRIEQARQNISDGWLSVGGQILADAPSDNGQAQLLQQELVGMRMQAEDAVAKAEQALERDDIEAALDVIRLAGVTQNQNGRVGELLHRVKKQAAQRAQASLERGRIDRAQSLLQRLSPLGVDGQEIAELRRALTCCHQAAECIAAGQPDEALPLLGKVKTMYPSAKWLDQAVSGVKQAGEVLAELCAGPLGLSIAEASGHPGFEPPRCPAEPEQARPQKNRVPDAHRSPVLPSEFVMQIDGVGSYLVFRDNCVTVGPISSSARPMLGLMADPSLPSIGIERVDTDYFIRSDRAIEINGRPATETMLADGDVIALSTRCRLRFRVPNPASATAVLMLSGARLGDPDIRQVILMGRDILAGPYTNNHIQSEQLDEIVTFFAQNDRLLCRASVPVTVGNRPLQPETGLMVDRPIQIGKLSMVLAKFRA